MGPDGAEGERITTITGLKRGAGADGRVAADALERLDACLAGYGARIAAFAPGRVVALGTSAVRDAPNRDAVAALVRNRLGVPLRVLGGEEEARLAFAGARLAAPDDGPVLVIDVGGGSTELVWGDAGGPDGAVSLDVGSVRCSERHLRHDPPLAEETNALAGEVEALARLHVSRLSPPPPVIGVAGTVTTLAAVRQGGYDPRRVHGAALSAAEVAEVVDMLAALPLDARRRVPGLHPARAPAIVGGGVIVTTLLAALSAPGLTVSERDLLDGVLMATDALSRPD
jgi:exopolyphosphatase/guanosine-5'-triphosphate,3'-diphosphate pyrophosphatase